MSDPAGGVSAVPVFVTAGGTPESITGAVPLVSLPASPSAAGQAMTQPARMTDRHNVTVANRRVFMIPASKGST